MSPRLEPPAQSYHLLTVLASGDVKTGPVGATYRSLAQSCPPCGIVDECYAGTGRVAIIQKRAAAIAHTVWKLCGLPLIRHCISGDVFKRALGGRRILDRAYIRDLKDFHSHRSQRFTIGWMYTHAAKQLKRAGFGPRWWPAGLHVLASCETIADARELQSDGWVTARVTTVKDRQPGEVYCPYDLSKHHGQKPSTNCQRCRLCFDGRKKHIVFMLLTRKKG